MQMTGHKTRAIFERYNITSPGDLDVAAGTTLMLSGNNSYASSINFPNGKGHAAALSLSPPTSSSDPWQGVSLYQDPALTNNVNDDWGPGATFNVDGVVYLPNADLVMHGSGASNNSGLAHDAGTRRAHGGVFFLAT